MRDRRLSSSLPLYHQGVADGRAEAREENARDRFVVLVFALGAGIVLGAMAMALLYPVLVAG